MSKATIDPADELQWAEGMLLKPQHFQQVSIRRDALLRLHISLVSTHHYGLLWNSAFRPGLTAGGLLTIGAFECVMPDGMALSHDGTIPLELDLASTTEGSKETAWIVYLQIPTRKPDQKNILPDDANEVEGGPFRFTSWQEPNGSVDENTGEFKERLSRLKPNVSLTTEKSGKKSTGYQRFPLLKVKKDDSKAFSLDEDFIGTQLNLPSNSPLERFCRDTLDLIGTYVQGLRSSLVSQMGVVSDGGRYLLTLHQTTLLTSVYAALEEHLGRPSVHPSTLYWSFFSAARQLSVLRLTNPFSTLEAERLHFDLKPKYNHDSQRSSFEPLVESILLTLQEAFGEHTRFDFAWSEEYGRYFMATPSEDLADQVIVGVRRQYQKTMEETVEWMNTANIFFTSNLSDPPELKERSAGLYREVWEGQGTFQSGSDVQYFVLDGVVSSGTHLVIDNANSKNDTKPARIALFDVEGLSVDLKYLEGT